MNKRVKKKWLKALRSGDYIQCTAQLRTNLGDGGFSYCCLGVLCDLYAKSKGLPFSRVAVGSKGLPPKAIVKWAGLEPECRNEIKVGSNTDSPAGQNDNGATFAEIADAIEAQL